MTVEVTVVGKVQRGSIVTVVDRSMSQQQITDIVEGITHAAGHDRFVLVILEPGTSIDVMNPADARAALTRIGSNGHHAS